MHTYEIKDYSSLEYESRLRDLFERITPSSWMRNTRREIKGRVKELVDNRYRKADYLTQYKENLEKTSEEDDEYQRKMDEAVGLSLMFYNDETFHSLDYKVIKDFVMFLGEFEKDPAHLLLELMELKGIVKTDQAPSLLSEHRMLARKVNALWINIYNRIMECSYSSDELLLVDDFSSKEQDKQNQLNDLRRIRTKIGVAEYLEPKEDSEEQIREMIVVLEESEKVLQNMLNETEYESGWNDEEYHSLLVFPDET